MEEALIQYKNVEIHQQELCVLSEVNLQLHKGEFVYLVGKVGSGKTSLLKTLYGELDVTAGEAEVLGYRMTSIKRKHIPQLRRKLGIVFQDFQLLTDRTVNDNLEFVLRATGWKNKQEIKERIAEVLNLVGMENKGYKLPNELSGGEQQRVAIAIALSNNPSLLLADEPTGAVDTKTAAMVLDVFKQLNRQTGVTIIIVTHDTNLSKSIDRVVAIRDGRTSSEMLRKKTEILSFGELEKMSEQQRAEHEKLMQQSGSDQEELVVLDRAGRLQIPKEYLEALGIRGGDKVRVELEDGKISVYNSDYNMHG